jgi:two-component system, response regulator, stage 0 sporulation protein F
MSKKRILIVDDEESILSVLRNSLLKLNKNYEVETRKDGFEAITLIQREKFDMVVTDYKMAGLDGLELIEAVRTMSPDTRVVLITAYGNNTIEARARELQAFRYLTKPLELDSFRQVVQEGLGDDKPAAPEPAAQPPAGQRSAAKPRRADLLVLSDERYRQISKLLSSLEEDVGARCILLTDANGRLMAHTGDIGGLEVEELGSLMGGGMASLLEVGRTLDRDEDAVNSGLPRGGKGVFVRP